MNLRKLKDEQGREYFIDEKNQVYIGEEGVYLCITLNDRLILDGEARELTHRVAMLRKQLGLKPTDSFPEK